MAKLHECGDCGSDISRKARACPNCGAPQKRPNDFLTIVCALGLLVWGWNAVAAGQLPNPLHWVGAAVSGFSEGYQGG